VSAIQDSIPSVLRRAHGATWLVAAAIYGGWFSLTFAHARIPLPLLVVLGGVTLAWHGSLQHETIHGHPAGPRWVGWALGVAPLSLWLPYTVYRDTHRLHHATPHLTDPAHDPESPPCVTARATRVGRQLAASQQTALGRLVLGPPLTIASFLATELSALVRGVRGRRRAWAVHALLVAIVLVWLLAVAHMPIGKYLLAFVYPGASLTLLRSFAEHRVARAHQKRTCVVEAGPFFALLYLNNNLHAVHHETPHAPWFELPGLWKRRRAAFATATPDLVVPGYVRLVHRYALRPIPTEDLP
jgi:fatty acid desaturase